MYQKIFLSPRLPWHHFKNIWFQTIQIQVTCFQEGQEASDHIRCYKYWEETLSTHHQPESHLHICDNRCQSSDAERVGNDNFCFTEKLTEWTEVMTHCETAHILPLPLNYSTQWAHENKGSHTKLWHECFYFSTPALNLNLPFISTCIVMWL